MDIHRTRSRKVYTYGGGHTVHYDSQRDAKQAINEKIRVLKDFYIVDKSNEETVRAQMQAELDKRPDIDFDIVLDGFAKKLIGEKLG